MEGFALKIIILIYIFIQPSNLQLLINVKNQVFLWKL